MPADSVEHLLANGLEKHQSGLLEQAILAYKAVLESDGRHEAALAYLGVAYMQLGRFKEAKISLERSIASNPANGVALSNLGYCLLQEADFYGAERACKSALAIDPSNHGALTNLGGAYMGMGRSGEARRNYELALRLQPQNASYVFNVATSHMREGSFKLAVDLLRQSIALNDQIAEAHNNLAVCLMKLNLQDEALASANIAVTLDPNNAEALNTRGTLLYELWRRGEALSSYRRAIDVSPNFSEAWGNLGNCLHDLGRHEEALQAYESACRINPNNGQFWVNQAALLIEKSDPKGAIECYKKALSCNPVPHFALGDFLMLRRMICDWDQLDQWLRDLPEKLLSGDRLMNPFVALAFFDSPKIHKTVAQTYCLENYQPIKLTPQEKLEPKSKIKIGYFSMDFREHPVAHLIVELIENHDRTKFEITGFSLGPESNDPLGIRLRRAFDRFVDISTLSDRSIVETTRGMNIDIAVDLSGYTKGSRPRIFATRLAPIQINYLGYPGTLGMPNMDYLMADPIVISEQNRHDISEKVIFLPHCYQINQSIKDSTPVVTDRNDHGLPADSFVFSCFNNNWKITPAVFDVWMQILFLSSNAVLWLYADSPAAIENLKAQAIKQGVDAERLIFATRTEHSRHMERYRFVDLVLDTFPYNAHTTASDALRMGAPILTVAGRSFPARVAASLLKNLGIDELITLSMEDYKAMAIKLANDPAEIERLKEKIKYNKRVEPLFEVFETTKNIEAAYLEVIKLHRQGAGPRDIHLKGSEKF